MLNCSCTFKISCLCMDAVFCVQEIYVLVSELVHLIRYTHSFTEFENLFEMLLGDKISNKSAFIRP